MRNFQKIVDKLPSMSIQELINLWINSIKIESDPTKRKTHPLAKLVIDAIANEWTRR